MFVTPNVVATIRDNDISGRNTGIYTDSKIANLHGNLVHNNTVGITSRQGVICGTGCGWTSLDASQSNQIFENETGIFIPQDGIGVLIGLTDIFDNGIENLGDRPRLILNQIHGNETGIQGTSTLGPESWEGSLFNDIYGNDVGVRTCQARRCDSIVSTKTV